MVHQVLSQSGEKYGYLNFEDEQLPTDLEFDLIDSCLKEIYPDATIYFFDEIQIFPRWEQLLNRLERVGKRIVITGSNSKLLSSELSSSLAGRHELFEVFPFSFKEYCSIDPSSIDPSHGAASIKNYSDKFKQDLQTGGLPDVAMGRVNARNYLRDLWDSIILKDIVQPYKVRSVTELKALTSIIRESLACRLSHRSLEHSMLGRVSIATVGKFIGCGQGAYLTFLLQNFSFKARERVNSDKKAYLIDNGFYTSMKVGGQEDYGRLLENFIFNTLLRRGLQPNLDFFYYLTKSAREVDFITLQNGKPASKIQVCWSLGHESTLERDLTGLAEAATDLGITSTTIVTWQEKASHTRNGIKIDVIPVVEFLEISE